MRFLDYLQTDQATLDQYLDQRWVTVQHHGEFALDIYTYGRTCQYEGKWDNITSRCRGIIVNRLTGEIVARPFEKFHNFETGGQPKTHATSLALISSGVEMSVWEKMDGFMATLYEWEGQEYIASKGSFTSPHSKWATAQYRKQKRGPAWPEGWTPVFEGISASLRIVVDYKSFESLVLLAIINKETGEEMPPAALTNMANLRGFPVPRSLEKSWIDAVHITRSTSVKGEEGFVCTWYFPGVVPFRVKLKYIDYIRLHRIVSGVSPKHIWEALSQGMSLDEWENDSTQWFSKFVAKWKRALMTSAMDIEKNSKAIFEEVSAKFDDKTQFEIKDIFRIRKEFALEFTKPENKEYSAVLFALLDGKDIKPIIWKKVKHLIVGSRPMIDAHAV